MSDWGWTDFDLDGVGEEVAYRSADATEVDRHGNPVADGVRSGVLVHCIIEPLGVETIVEEDREGRVQRVNVYAPLGGDVRHGDNVSVRGEDYEVTGSPVVWLAPDATHGGIVVAAQKAVG